MLFNKRSIGIVAVWQNSRGWLRGPGAAPPIGAVPRALAGRLAGSRAPFDNTDPLLTPSDPSDHPLSVGLPFGAGNTSFKAIHRNSVERTNQHRISLYKGKLDIFTKRGGCVRSSQVGAQMVDVWLIDKFRKKKTLRLSVS